MPWYFTFNDIFWMSIAGLILGAFAKCRRIRNRIQCCGTCLIIEPGENTDLELETNNPQPINNTPSTSNISTGNNTPLLRREFDNEHII